MYRGFSRFECHLISEFKDFYRNLRFGDFLSIDFRKITVNPILL